VRRLGFKGTKEACGLGECGTCTVIIEGTPVLACLTLALEAQGKEITTVEGLSEKLSGPPDRRCVLNDARFFFN